MTNAEELIAKLINDKRITGEEAVILLNEIITNKLECYYTYPYVTWGTLTSPLSKTFTTTLTQNY